MLKLVLKKAAPCCEGCCFCFWMGFHWFRKSMKGLIVLHTYVYIYTSDVHIYSSIKKEEIGNNPSMDEMKFIN